MFESLILVIFILYLAVNFGIVVYLLKRVLLKLDKHHHIMSHETQQIKTGDEWSKKREKELLKKVNKLG